VVDFAEGPPMKDTGAAGRILGRDDLVADVVEQLMTPCAVLTLVGEAGIGKTALWSEVLTRTDAAWIWAARCLEVESELGLAVLGDLFAAVPDDVIDTLPAPQRRAVDIVLYRENAESEGGRIGDHLLGTTTLSIVRELASRGTVVLGVDDVQWCDAVSFAALDYALHRLDGEPVIVLASRRTGAVREFADSEQIRVPPLAAESVVDLVHAITGHQVHEARVAGIVAMSGGNPFFARELAQQLATNPTEQRLPTSLREALGRRFDAFDKSTKSALIDVAVRGAPRADEPDLGDLGLALHADIVLVDDGRIRFTHPLLVNAVLESASPTEIREAHRRAAGVSNDPVAAALHRARSSAPGVEVAAALDAAVELAIRRSDLHGAAELARLALSLSPGEAPRPPHRLVALAERLHELDELADASGLAGEALAKSADPEIRYRALLIAAETHPDPSRMYEMLDEAAELPGLSAERRAVALSGKAMVLRRDGRLREAADVLDRALAETEPGFAGWSHLVALSVLVNRVTGRLSDEEMLRTAVDIERRLASSSQPTLLSRSNAGTALAASAIVAGYEDRHDEATALLAEAGALAAAQGISSLAAGYPAHLAWRMGDLSRATEELTWVLRHGDPSRHGVVLCRLAAIDACCGHAAEAQRKIAEARRRWSPNRDTSELEFADGFVSLITGDPRQAWPHLSAAARELDAMAYREPSQPAVLPAAIEAAAAVGELDAAEVLCTRLERDSAALQSRFGRAAARRSRGFIARARGENATAEAAFADSAAAFVELRVPLEGARAYLALGSLLRRAGQRRRARDALQTARGIFTDCGAIGLARDADAELGKISGRTASPSSGMTESERQVAELVATGMRNNDVAAALHLSVKTVETHLGRAYRKLGVTNRTELTRRLSTTIDEGNP
jgi:DNA-binding CsgD family transcriptional regulator/tetratricopeptide (TPR) repeat protein